VGVAANLIEDNPAKPPRRPGLQAVRPHLMDADHHRVIVEALATEHRRELAEAHALVIRYRYVLEEHGIEPPDDTGREALERFRHAFQMAGMYDSMQHPELLQGPWRQ